MRLALAAVAATLTTAACATAPMAPSAMLDLPGSEARAELVGRAGAAVGTVLFRPAPTGVLIRLQARGLTPGWHGLHLHVRGDCADPAFQSAGGHVDHASDRQHGLVNPGGPEAGDLPNLWVGADGRATVELFTDMVSLGAGSGERPALLDADGAAILIHAGPDDHATQPIGGSGDRVACGVIRAGS